MRIEHDPSSGVSIEYLTKEEGRALLERQTQKYLGLSGEEFAQRYRAGVFEPCDSTWVRLSLLLPLAGMWPQ